MSKISTLKFFLDHPLNKKKKINTIFKVLKWLINIRLNPHPLIFPFAEKSKMIMLAGQPGATGNLYCGLLEFEDMAFVLHFLRDTDTFVDIGANIGSYTLLGASEKGAKTISIEPIPETFQLLEMNILINKIQDKVRALNIGLGAEKGQLKFTNSQTMANHVASNEEKDTVKIAVEKFDNIIHLHSPTLMKIDVEGFETEVINGMPDALLNENLKAIIIELNGLGNRYGYDDNVIHKKLLSHGFMPFIYAPFQRKLTPVENFGKHNTIYIKDFEFAKNRVESAKKIRINSKEF